MKPQNVTNPEAYRARFGIPHALGSCHTAVVEGYAIEGHVPAADVKRLLAEGKLDAAHYKDVLMHRIDGGDAMEKFTAATKSSTDKALIHSLRDLGIACGRQWLTERYRSLGVESTVNIAHDYLDDLRVPVKKAEPPVFPSDAGLL